MYCLVILLAVLHVISSENTKYFVIKYPTLKTSSEAPLETTGRHQDAVGTTYQAITKRKFTGASSSSTTAEILNTITSPHSRSSVSFTKTTMDHSADEDIPTIKPIQNFDLQNYIVNEPNSDQITENQIPYLSPSRLNQSLAQNTVRVSPKAFSYQPVYTVINNIKSFYKVPKYTPFVVPPRSQSSNQYYEPQIQNSDISDNLVPKFSYPNFDIPDTRKYHTLPPVSIYPEYYPTTSTSRNPNILPTNTVSYNVSSETPFRQISELPSTPLSTPIPRGLSLLQVVPKPYKESGYIEPDRNFLFRPVLFVKKIPSIN